MKLIIIKYSQEILLKGANWKPSVAEIRVPISRQKANDMRDNGSI